MNNYNSIINCFRKQGYNEHSQLSEGQLNRVLDSICNQNIKVAQYDRNVAAQIWDQTPKQETGTVTLKNYAQTMVKAIHILENGMENTEKQIQRTNDPQIRQNLKQDLLSFSEDYKFLTLPFGIRTSLRMSHDSNISGRASLSNNSTVIFAKEYNTNSSGTDLKVVYILNWILLCIELILMFHKHHFYSLLAFLAVLAIFVLNYFDNKYMKFVLANLGISCLLDLVWMFVLANEYWYIKPQTQHSTLHSGFLKFIVFFVAILVILKIILIAILFKYRSNPSSIRRKIQLCGFTFNLDGSPSDNLLTRLFQPRRQNNFVQ